MEVLVAADEMGALSSAEAGRALAAGWSAARTTVVPVGEAGAGFVRAWGDGRGAALDQYADDRGGVVTSASAGAAAVLQVEVDQPGAGIPYGSSSQAVGAALAEVLLRRHLRRVLVDLTGCWVHDGGAGLLAALGAVADGNLRAGAAGLSSVRRVDVDPARAAVADVELVGVVPAAELARPLLGLRGITSLRGREADEPAELMLATDADLERFAGLLGPGIGTQPGAGACGGLGLAVLALGGRLVTGPDACFEGSPTGRPDLVVTGCSVFDFHRRGGGVVATVAERAAAALAPCVVVAGEVMIGGREMRTMGVEAAYAVRESTSEVPTVPDLTAAEVTATAVRVARSWSW